VQLLNTSAWMLYASDLDPERSHAELVAYLLVHGDRMALTGEVTMAAVHNAAYWFERTDAEHARLRQRRRDSVRPDAEAFRALASAIPWFRQLYHDVLQPPPPGVACHAIPRSGLLVPQEHTERPAALVQRWTEISREALNAYHAKWRPPDHTAVAELCDWLARDVPRCWSPDGTAASSGTRKRRREPGRCAASCGRRVAWRCAMS